MTYIRDLMIHVYLYNRQHPLTGSNPTLICIITELLNFQECGPQSNASSSLAIFECKYFTRYNYTYLVTELLVSCSGPSRHACGTPADDCKHQYPAQLESSSRFWHFLENKEQWWILSFFFIKYLRKESGCSTMSQCAKFLQRRQTHFMDQ